MAFLDDGSVASPRGGLKEPFVNAMKLTGVVLLMRVCRAKQ